MLPDSWNTVSLVKVTSDSKAALPAPVSCRRLLCCTLGPNSRVQLVAMVMTWNSCRTRCAHPLPVAFELHGVQELVHAAMPLIRDKTGRQCAETPHRPPQPEQSYPAATTLIDERIIQCCGHLLELQSPPQRSHWGTIWPYQTQYLTDSLGFPCNFLVFSRFVLVRCTGRGES